MRSLRLFSAGTDKVCAVEGQSHCWGRQRTVQHRVATQESPSDSRPADGDPTSGLFHLNALGSERLSNSISRSFYKLPNIQRGSLDIEGLNGVKIGSSSQQTKQYK